MKNTTPRFKGAGIAAFVALASAGQPIAYAQETSSRTLEEIVVSAQRVSQSLQDVPISISVVTGEDFANNAILDFAETAALTPGVALNTASPALAAIKIRGVGPSFFATGGSQSVTIFVDEFAQSQPGAVFSTLVDIERLELLKGPQGTLYGRNAPAGAYNITTKAPSTEGIEGYLEGTLAQWDSNGEETIDVRGAINLPLVDDKLAMRIAAVYADSEGYIDMPSPLAEEKTNGGKEHKSVRARFLWNINDGSDLNIIANYQDLQDYYAVNQYEGLVPGTGGTNPFPAQFNDFDDRRDFSTLRSSSATDIKDISMHYRWAGDLTNIDALASYSQYDTDSIQIPNGFPSTARGRFRFQVDTKQSSFELRASDSGEVLDYVAGIYIIRREGGSDSFFELPGIDIPTDVFLDGGGEAIFANVTFHLHDEWDLGLGVRYEEYAFDATSETAVQSALGDFPGTIDSDVDFSYPSWSIKLKYFPSEDTTFYLAIDNAYRQGGFNYYMPPVAAIGEAFGSPALVDLANDLLESEKEVSTAFEIGVKGQALDDRLRYAIAIFYQEFEDHIIQSAAPNTPGLELVAALFELTRVNAEEVVTQGIELETTYLVDDHWTVNFRGAYFDATIEKWDDKLCSNTFNDPVGDVFCPADSGLDLTALPKVNLNTQINYTRSINDDWAFNGNVSWTFKPESSFDGQTDRFNDSINLINLVLGVSNDAYTVRAWVKNLTDEDENQVPFGSPNGDTELPNAWTGSFFPGREYGVTFNYRF